MTPTHGKALPLNEVLKEIGISILAGIFTLIFGPIYLAFHVIMHLWERRNKVN